MTEDTHQARPVPAEALSMFEGVFTLHARLHDEMMRLKRSIETDPTTEQVFPSLRTAKIRGDDVVAALDKLIERFPERLAVIRNRDGRQARLDLTPAPLASPTPSPPTKAT